MGGREEVLRVPVSEEGGGELGSWGQGSGGMAGAAATAHGQAGCRPHWLLSVRQGRDRAPTAKIRPRHWRPFLTLAMLVQIKGGPGA